MKNIAIAVDGPAGAGKSTIAKLVAKKYNLVYIDTGAMYRTVALYAIKNKLGFDSVELISSLDNIDIDIEYENDIQHMILNGEDVTGIIRTEEVGMGASAVAKLGEVRQMLVSMQRKIASSKNVIMDGRDIGTHVLPNADLKIFLTASSSERAQRRVKELLEKGVKADFETVKIDIEQRDKQDSERAISPLKKADDAIEVDTSGMGIEAVCEKIGDLINTNIN